MLLAEITAETVPCAGRVLACDCGWKLVAMACLQLVHLPKSPVGIVSVSCLFTRGNGCGKRSENQRERAKASDVMLALEFNVM